MHRHQWLMPLVLAGTLAAASFGRGCAIAYEGMREPQMPRLDIGPPEDMAAAKEGAPPAWRPTSQQVEEAVERGRAAARAGKPPLEVLAPWRLVVDKDGEYATFLTPLAAASVLGYQAEERSWSEARLKQGLDEALARFSSGVCLYVELRSFAHESRSVSIFAAGIVPGRPDEAYEATFLLGSGDRKHEGLTPRLEPERVGEVHINSAGHYCQVVPFPEVVGDPGMFGEHAWGQSFGANYYVWWPFVDDEGQPSFGPDVTNLRLTLITPRRKREYLSGVTPEGLRMD